MPKSNFDTAPDDLPTNRTSVNPTSHQAAQQLLPALMSFGPPFVIPPPSTANQTCSSGSSTSLAHLQHHQEHQEHQQQQQQQIQLQAQREAVNHNNHSGHTHAIQLQTSLEMGPVVCPALCEIRTQLQELTRSVESCQNEVRIGRRRCRLGAVDFILIRFD